MKVCQNLSKEKNYKNGLLRVKLYLQGQALHKN